MTKIQWFDEDKRFAVGYSDRRHLPSHEGRLCSRIHHRGSWGSFNLICLPCCHLSFGDPQTNHESYQSEVSWSLYRCMKYLISIIWPRPQPLSSSNNNNNELTPVSSSYEDIGGVPSMQSCYSAGMKRCGICMDTEYVGRNPRRHCAGYW